MLTSNWWPEPIVPATEPIKLVKSPSAGAVSPPVNWAVMVLIPVKTRATSSPATGLPSVSTLSAVLTTDWREAVLPPVTFAALFPS